MKVISVLLLIVTLASLSKAKVQFLSQEFIASINIKQNTWIAGSNFPEDTPREYLKRLAGSLDDPDTPKVPLKIHKVNPRDIPETFDGRTHWSQCESLKDIRNQGGCGSCWAFGASEVMTDRLCIATDGKQKFKFSPEDLITCCDYCGDCDGGWGSKAYQYWSHTGIVSGGDYNSGEGCLPYQADPFKNGVTPPCTKACVNNNYGTSYVQDKHLGSSYYNIDADVQQIQAEILKNGPVEASYDVYEDFYNYKSGVYVHTTGDHTGRHAVKVIGWGTEDGTPYWLIANSWGADWGGLDGFFKILRGENHCGIEGNIWAGLPKV